MKTKLTTLLMALLLLPFGVSAQMQEGAAMADAFRADGKIYVVIGVLLIIFFGIAFYLFRLDRKISQLEKNAG